MIAFSISGGALLFLFRLRLLYRLWRLPLRNGEGFFLAQRVGPDFYQAAGAPLFRRYHISLFVPLVLDAPLVAWLVLARSYVPLALEQLIAMVITIVIYNVMAVYFSARATAVCGLQEERPATSLQLSVAPRRMRDYMTPAVEAQIVAATLLSLGMLAHGYVLSAAPGASHGSAHAFRGGVVLTAWVLYWQIGFFLLKGVFVHWRMPLPVNRTEDFRKWRTAWLNHNLKIFDAVRLFCALSLLAGMIWVNYGREWQRTIQTMIIAIFVLVVMAYVVYVVREERRLAAKERELKPIEMVKEFPRWPIAEGRYLVGGLLYFNRDNPRALVRSSSGIALNLAHRTIYLWVAYFAGLIVMAIWMARLAH